MPEHLKPPADCMANDIWTAVDEYLAPRLAPHDKALDAALAASHVAELPEISVSANQGKLLQVLARSVQAKAILEIGTLGGYSTIWLARALAEGGQVVTLEADPKHADVAQANIANAGLAGCVDIRVGLAIKTLPMLEQEEAGPFDFVFIDANKEEIPDYFAWALKLTRPGGLIVIDNVVREGELANAETDDERVIGCRRLVDLLEKESRVAATVVQTVGAKGHDGFALVNVLKNFRGHRVD